MALIAFGPGSKKLSTQACACRGEMVTGQAFEFGGIGAAGLKGSNQIELQLGYIHPVVLDLPEGVKAEVDKSQTAITITGYDKEVVGNFAAVVRSKRPPEVYKGKGIRYADEYVRMKEGKAGKK